MLSKLWQNKIHHAEDKIKLFIIVFNIGLFLQVLSEINFISSTVHGCGIFIRSLDWNSLFVVYALLLVTLVSIFSFKMRGRAWLYLLQLILYYVLFSDFLICQSGVEKIGMASNHAIVFWILLSLTLIEMLRSEKIIFLLKFLLIWSYFNSALAKLLHDVHWVNGYTIQWYFLERHTDLNLPLAIPFITNHALAIAVSVVVLGFEITAPLALLNRKLEIFYLAVFLSFQIACYFVLEVRFMKYYGLCYLIYFADYVVDGFHYVKPKFSGFLT